MNQEFKIKRAELSKVNVEKDKKKILKQLEEENKKIREASSVDTKKLNLRFEF